MPSVLPAVEPLIAYAARAEHTSSSPRHHARCGRPRHHKCFGGARKQEANQKGVYGHEGCGGARELFGDFISVLNAALAFVRCSENDPNSLCFCKGKPNISL